MSLRERLKPFSAVIVLPFGALASALTFLIYLSTFSFGFFLYAFFIALLHAYLLGLPLYLLLSKDLKHHWLTPLICGFAIGALPATLFTLSVSDDFSYSAGGTPHIVEGVRTAEGWISYLKFICSAGSLGIIGSMTAWAFWKILQTDMNKS